MRKQKTTSYFGKGRRKKGLVLRGGLQSAADGSRNPKPLFKTLEAMPSHVVSPEKVPDHSALAASLGIKPRFLLFHTYND